MLMFDENTTGIFFAAAAISSFCASVKPVVQITAAVFVFTHSASRSSAASGVEKSTSASTFFASVRATPSALTTSILTATSTFASSAAFSTAWPMRPQAPLIAIFIGSFPLCPQSREHRVEVHPVPHDLARPADLGRISRQDLEVPGVHFRHDRVRIPVDVQHRDRRPPDHPRHHLRQFALAGDDDRCECEIL